MCNFLNCTKKSSYNMKEQKKAIFCFDHKSIDMINVKTKKCIDENCDKIPSYNIIGEKKQYIVLDIN